MENCAEIKEKSKILILATVSGGYAGADSVGQLHSEYPTNTYILPVKCPSLFSKDFYIRSFKQGIDAIIIMYSGTDCPYKGGPEQTAKIVNERTRDRYSQAKISGNMHCLYKAIY
jgi:coenzyme F420-reducing hydrogenase delta subunit